MDRIQLQQAVDGAIARRNIIDDVLGAPALSHRELRSIIDEAMIDGIKPGELAAARSLASSWNNAALRVPTRDNREHAAAYAQIAQEFEVRASGFTKFLAIFIP